MQPCWCHCLKHLWTLMRRLVSGHVHMPPFLAWRAPQSTKVHAIGACPEKLAVLCGAAWNAGLRWWCKTTWQVVTATPRCCRTFVDRSINASGPCSLQGTQHRRQALHRPLTKPAPFISHTHQKKGFGRQQSHHKCPNMLAPVKSSKRPTTRTRYEVLGLSMVALGATL